MFFMGLALWIATVVITYLTGNANLIPTIVLLASFLVPATFVVWAFEHSRSREVSGEIVFRTFAVGGVLGVFRASLLETYLLHPSPWLFVGRQANRGIGQTRGAGSADAPSGAQVDA